METLPLEILYQVLYKIELPYLLNLFRVNSYFNNIKIDNTFWKLNAIYQFNYSLSDTNNNYINFTKLYMLKYPTPISLNYHNVTLIISQVIKLIEEGYNHIKQYPIYDLLKLYLSNDQLIEVAIKEAATIGSIKAFNYIIRLNKPKKTPWLLNKQGKLKKLYISALLATCSAGNSQFLDFLWNQQDENKFKTNKIIYRCMEKAVVNDDIKLIDKLYNFGKFKNIPTELALIIYNSNKPLYLDYLKSKGYDITQLQYNVINSALKKSGFY